MATAPSASSSPSTAVTGDTNTTPPPSSSAVPDASPSPFSAIDFLTICHHLKKTKRAGWVRRDVKDPESVADHMYRMSLMALIAPDVPGLDRNKCIKMAIVHDIAEALIGDITPMDGVSKADKSEREQAALEYMCKIIGAGEGSRGKEITELWMDYEANSSPEAKFVKDLDKVEMILQALDYEDGSKGRIWMNFSVQLLGSSKLKLAKLGHQRLYREGVIPKSSCHYDSTLQFIDLPLKMEVERARGFF